VKNESIAYKPEQRSLTKQLFANDRITSHTTLLTGDLSRWYHRDLGKRGKGYVTPPLRVGARLEGNGNLEIANLREKGIIETWGRRILERVATITRGMRKVTNKKTSNGPLGTVTGAILDTVLDTVL